MAPYREETLTIGSKPRVFQTAPPQPASNARRTWYSEFVGGPDASQNGLGALTPQNVTERSTMRDSTCQDGSSNSHQRGMDSPRRHLAVLDGVDDLAAITQAVAPGIQPGDAGRAGLRLDDDPPLLV